MQAPPHYFVNGLPSARVAVYNSPAFAQNRARFRIEWLMLRNRNNDPASEAPTIALQALAFQLADDNYRDRFLAQCGVAPQDLAAMVEDHAFLAGVLDMLLNDEGLLLAFCAEAGLKTDQIERASRAMSPVANE